MILKLIKHQQPDIAKIYLYLKEPIESKYRLLITGREEVLTKKLKIQNHSLITRKQVIMFMKIWKFIIQQRKGEW